MFVKSSIKGVTVRTNPGAGTFVSGQVLGNLFDGDLISPEVFSGICFAPCRQLKAGIFVNLSVYICENVELEVELRVPRKERS